MDRLIDIRLVVVTLGVDDIGQQTETRTERILTGTRGSITRSEWLAAAQGDRKPAFMVSISSFDYENEKTAIVDGVEYTIYRTYEGKGDTVELYLEERAGNGRN